jgi:hypothetical protein
MRRAVVLSQDRSLWILSGNNSDVCSSKPSDIIAFPCGEEDRWFGSRSTTLRERRAWPGSLPRSGDATQVFACGITTWPSFDPAIRQVKCRRSEETPMLSPFTAMAVVLVWYSLPGLPQNVMEAYLCLLQVLLFLIKSQRLPAPRPIVCYHSECW